ncbi:MAG: metallophosphoesterase [Clostridia bacterium]|nr:metallophosphoesterase [Clostridia bacterium]
MEVILTPILGGLLHIVDLFMQIILTVALGFGWVTGPATDDPITFQDPENVQMSFVLWADTHTRSTAFNPYWLECGFEDIDNSGLDFDAFVIAGDISEFGDAPSYELVWDAIADSSIADETVFLATGNHDIRLAYESQTEMIMTKESEYLGVEIDKPYYSYDVNGYTFIVMGSDEWQFEKAIISDEQLAFLDSEITRATATGKPAFVICHQPLANTHGLPEVWENGDLGEDSEAVKEVLLKHKNVFFLNGHLHDGVYEKSLEVFNEANGVYSINIPAYGKDNDYGEWSQTGLGDYVEVYADRVVFTARDFQAGQSLEGMTYTFYLK